MNKILDGLLFGLGFWVAAAAVVSAIGITARMMS